MCIGAHHAAPGCHAQQKAVKFGIFKPKMLLVLILNAFVAIKSRANNILDSRDSRCRQRLYKHQCPSWQQRQHHAGAWRYHRVRL